MIEYTYDPATHCAGITIAEAMGDVRVVDVSASVIATVDSRDVPCSIEVLDTTPWGTPFDADAAERLVTWVRTRLASGAAA